MNQPESPRIFGLTGITRVFVPFALGYFLSYIYRVVNAVLAPHISQELSLNAEQLGLLTSLYFLTFALSQIPLGMILDHYGPRITESVLLLLAVIGSLLFALAESASLPLLGRALIGVGVSACLMAAFKAYSIWFSISKLPLIYGLQMAAGGLGALAATTPVEFILPSLGWRGVFFLLAALTLATALLIFLLVPDQQKKNSDTTLTAQFRGTVKVFKSRVFWCIAPVTMVSQAGFLSVQSLWSGPWLRDVAGLSNQQTARYLALIACAMIAGFLTIGSLTTWLRRFKIKTVNIAMLFMALFIVSQAMIHGLPLEHVLWGWLAFGFFGTSGIISYAALTQSFPLTLSGRVNTAMNFLVFVAAFVFQWGIGIIIEVSSGSTHGYSAEAYRNAMFCSLFLQIVCWLLYFFIRPGRIAVSDSNA